MEILKTNERLDDLQFNNLFVIQDKNGYCFSSDAVSLANFVHISNYGRVVDLCSGSGIIGILVNAKNKVKDVTLVEIQENLADMSKRTIEYNNIKNISVINSKLQGISKVIGEGVFDVVTCNPPYKKQGTADKISKNDSIAICKHEILVTLEEIILEASKLLKYGGYFYVVNKEERLTDIMVLCKKYNLEPKELGIVRSSSGANVVMLKAKKGGKSGFKISLV